MPKTFIGDVANFPAALRPLIEQPHWVVWKWVRKNGKWTKPPYRADDPARLARTDDPQTWNGFSSAVKAVTGGRADGPGYALTNSGIAAVDLDHCRDAETGAIDGWAADLISRVPAAYTEVTASGCGLRIIGRGAGAELHRKFEIKGAQDGAAIELYRRATRYITVSGLEIGACDELPDIDNLLDSLVAEHTQAHAGGERTIRDIIKNGSPVGERSGDFNRVVWSLAGRGYGVDDIEERLAKYPSGIAAKYARRLRQEIERCYTKWESENETGTTGAPWDDPDWSLLDDRRGSTLPEFPADVLSDKWEELLARAAHGAGVTLGHVTVPLLATVASLIGTARRIRPSRSWSEPFTLWTGIVGFSGSGKTPGISVTKRALSLIESIRKEKIAELQRRHDTKSQTAKAAAKAWKEKVEEAVEANQPPPQMPVEAMDPGSFVTPRLYVSEATIERHAVLLQARPRGMLLMSDELASLFLNMGRYSNGSDKEFWLEAWNGNHYVVERMSRPPVTIDHLLIGMTGGFQPDKLARSFKGDSDGMHARVLFAWPEEPAFHSLTDDVTEVEPELLNALCRIVDLPAGEDDVFAPRDVRLSADARSQFEQFRQFQHRGKDALDGREREWWAKGPSQVLRLAGTLCYLDWAMEGGSEPQAVEVRFIEAAVRLWRDYLWPHSRAAVRQIGLTDHHAEARRVLRWMRAGRRDLVSREDVRRDALSQRLNADEVQTIIDELVRAGWMREVTARAEGPGRPARRWEVNPKLLSLGTAGIAGNAGMGPADA